MARERCRRDRRGRADQGAHVGLRRARGRRPTGDQSQVGRLPERRPKYLQYCGRVHFEEGPLRIP